MSKVSITRSLLDDLAMSISAKSGEAVPMTLTEMKDAVDSIQTGGSPTLQTKTKTYTPTTSQQTESVSADSGYDGLSTVNVTVNAMPSGTAGTPTATKGTVSNHSVTITPSVTNQTGWITGSTKTGTAVTVSASELVSGSETKTENGTYDVTNLASLVVNVSGGGSVTWETIYSGTVSIVSDSPNYVAINNWAPTHPTFEDGQTWRVTWNGTEYVCPVKTAQSTAYIGNAQIVGYSDTSNEPLFAYMRTSTQLSFATTDSTGSITLKMELQHDTSATLIEKSITANGTYNATDDDADGYSKVTVNVASGSSKNTQVVQSTTRTNASALTAIGAELTVSKTGTYDIYYSCFRTNTSSSYTWATRLYINGTAYGTAENTTWTNNQQNTHLSSISLTTGDKLRVYGRNTRGTSYYICAPILAIVET